MGYAHSAYTVTQIKECLESTANIEQTNKIAQEQSQRLVRLVGAQHGTQLINEGKPLKTKLNWLIGIGETVNMFIYNDNEATITGAPFQKLNGHMWIRDGSR